MKEIGDNYNLYYSRISRIIEARMKPVPEIVQWNSALAATLKQRYLHCHLDMKIIVSYASPVALSMG